MRTMWRIRADMRNQGYDLPDWVGKTLYWCYYTLDRRLVHAVSGIVKWLAHEILLSPSFSWWFVPSPLPLPKNTKLSHPSLSLHAMIRSQPGSRSMGWGWEVMILTGREDSRNCVDLRNRGKSDWDQKMGKIQCVFRIMRWCLSTPGPALQSLRIMWWCLSTPVCIAIPSYIEMMSFYSGVCIAIPMQACTEWTHSDVWSQLATTP